MDQGNTTNCRKNNGTKNEENCENKGKEDDAFNFMEI